jgi:hypothetical protein
MSSASDISNLFQMLGLSPSQYQEVERREQSDGSRGRWSAPAEAFSLAIANEKASYETLLPCPPAAAGVAATAPAMAEQPGAPAVSASAPGSVGELKAAPEQPVAQADLEPAAEAKPEPVTVLPQPAALNSVFARLLERNSSRVDGPRQPAP